MTLHNFLRAAQAARLKVSQFNRGQIGLLRPVAIMRNGFAAAGPRTRFFVLAGATLFLIFRFWFYFRQTFAPLWDKVTRLDTIGLTFNLVFLDLFVYVAAAMALVFALALIAGRMSPRPREGHPILVFLVAAPVLTVGLVTLPTWIADLFLRFDTPNAFSLATAVPHQPYAVEALRAALCVSLAIADAAAGPAALRWWLLPVLVLPSPTFNALPLVIWSAVAGWLPSRYWSLWRPVAVAATCILPVLAFPASQPIRPNFPIFGTDAYTIPCLSLGDKASGYEAKRLDGWPGFFLRVNTGLYHATPTPGGHWTCSGQSLDILWDQASFDAQRGAAYIYDGRERLIHTVDLKSFAFVKSKTVSVSDFPVWSEQIRQDFDPVRDIIAAADIEGSLITFSAPDLQVRNVVFQPWLGFTEEIHCDPAGGLIYVLQDYRLTAFRAEDMTAVRRIDFQSSAAGMALDPGGHRVFVSFPVDMQVGVFDLETGERLRTIDAPAAVRKLALDPARNLLLATSMTGAVEVRDARDFRLVKRVRMIPWTHWIELLPETGEAVLTGNRVRSVVWKYDAKPGRFDPVGRLLQFGEGLMKTAAKNLVGVKTPLASDFRIRENLMNGHETILAAEPDEEQGAILRSILEKAHYKVVLASSAEEFRREMERLRPAPDLAIVDFDVLLPSGEMLYKSVTGGNPGLAVLSAGRSPVGGRLPDLTRRFHPGNTLQKVRDELDKKGRMK